MSTTEPRNIFLEHRKDGELVDALSVTLEDLNGAYGIRELQSQVIVIPAGTPVPRVSLGRYEYNIDHLDPQVEYEFFFKVIDETNQVQFIYGQIPKVESETNVPGDKGATVPQGTSGIQVDIDGDGVFDGYAYDLDGDGYHESFDFNNDKIIDEIDVGKEVPGGGEFDARGVRIGNVGSWSSTSNFIEGELDGQPDVPSPRGTPGSGGTFGDTFGYDGLSGNVPATGGYRTNRDGEGNGYWDGISFEKLCYTKETKLLSEHNTIIRADKVKVGDKLVVYDVNNHKKTVQKVTKLHKNNTQDGKIYTIKTKRGRKLRTSGSHPYILSDGTRVKAKDLYTGQKLLVNATEGVEKQYDKIDTDIFTFENVVESFKMFNYNQNAMSFMMYDFYKNPWTHPTQDQLCFLAKMVGYIFGDGHLSNSRSTQDTNGRLSRVLISGLPEEIEVVRAELIKFGFTPQEKREVGSEISKWTNSDGIVQRIKGKSLQAACNSTLLAELLFIAGAPVGRKAERDYRIPQWILQNDLALKYFLSAYFGSDGTQPQAGKAHGTNLALTFNKINTLHESALEFAHELKSAFERFGVNSFVISHRPATDKTIEYKLKATSYTRQDLINFIENIGITFAPQRAWEWNLKREHIREQEKAEVNIQLLKKQIFEEHLDNTITQTSLAQKYSCGVDFVRKTIANKAQNQTRSRVPCFYKWKQQFTSFIYDEIEEIFIEESDEDVYDVTMETIFDIVTNSIVTQDCTIPIGPRGQCFKDKAHAATRTFLKDTDPSCLAFTDDEIDMYLEASLWAFNAKPTFTAFTWDHLQERWLDIITKGAVVWALYAQSLIESGREFTITDNGISYTPPPVSDKIQSYASTLLQHYDTNLTEIKSNFKPLPAAVGLFTVLSIAPGLRRLRHLREKRIF